MKLYKKNIAILMAGLLALSSGALVSSCDDDDDYDTNQFSGGVSLTAASLQVTRGAYMTFKGSNLNQITSVEFPGGVSSTPEVVDQYTIRALVPEEAEVGTVKLIYNGGELETKQIAFTEPIEFTGFKAEADPILAGQSVKITGTYLNYINFVQFATGDNVEVNNTNRTEFSVKVPIDASTGKLSIGYYSIDGTDTTEVLLESEEILNVVEPTSVKITNTTIKAGESLNITGVNLQLVKSINIPGQDAVAVPQASDPFAAKTAISAKVADTATDGNVTLTLYSGLEITAGSYATVLPTASIKDAKASYAVGDTVVITGDNLDLVKTVAFTNDASASYDANLVGSDLKVVVTTEAKSGDITLTLANGATVAVSGFETTKPAFTFPASATPLDVITVESTLAERVTTIKFGSLEATVTAKDGAFSATVPLDAESGKVTYVMDNGEECVAAESFTVNSFNFCAVYNFAAEETTLGQLLECDVKNGASLTNVLIGGSPTQYLLVGAKLYVNVGTETGDVKMTLVSGETNVDYTVKVVGAGIVETVLWIGAMNLEGWSANFETMVDFSGVPADAKIRVNFTVSNTYPQIKIFDGHWGNIYDGTTAELVADHIANSYIDLNPALLPYSDWGYSIILQGDGAVVSSISWVKDYSAPKAIWTGEFSNAGWGGNQDLAWGGFDWSTVSAGQTLYFSVKKNTTGAWGCLSLRHGNGWGALVDAPGQYDVADEVDETTIEFVLTQAAIDDLINNGGLVMTGDNLTITKVAIK